MANQVSSDAIISISFWPASFFQQNNTATSRSRSPVSPPINEKMLPNILLKLPKLLCSHAMSLTSQSKFCSPFLVSVP